MRVLAAAGLCFLLSACADGGHAPPPDGHLFSAEVDAGADADAGPAPACNWFVYWLTMVDGEVRELNGQSTACTWGMNSLDSSVALFRTNGGSCPRPVDICGVPACAEITGVRVNQVVEVWGPAGMDADAVWFATESYDCD